MGLSLKLSHKLSLSLKQRVHDGAGNWMNVGCGWFRLCNISAKKFIFGITKTVPKLHLLRITDEEFKGTEILTFAFSKLNKQTKTSQFYFKALRNNLLKWNKHISFQTEHKHGH